MAVVDELQIIVNAKTAKAIADLKKTQKATNNTAKSAASLVKSLLPIAGAAAGITMLARGALDAEKAFFAQEKAVALLNASLLATGEFSESTSRDIQDFASGLQSLTTVGDEATIQLVQYAISAGLTADQSKKAAQDAIGLSKAFGVDLQAAIKATTNAEQGNYDMLNRYLPAVKNAKDETEKAAIAQEQLKNAFNLATAEAETGSGTQQQYKNAIGDTQEAIGELVSSALTPLRRDLADTVTEFNNSSEAQERFRDAAGDIASIVGGFIAFKDAIFGIKDNIDGALESLGWFRTSAELLVGGPIKALIEFSKLPFKGIKLLLDNQQKQEEVLQAQWGYSQAIREEHEEIAEISEEISDSEKIIAEQLERQQASLDNRYKDVRSEVVDILKGEQSELDKLEEQYNRLADNPWASGRLEDDRLLAMEKLKEQMWEAADIETDWAEMAEAAWSKADEAFFSRQGNIEEGLTKQQELVLALGSAVENSLATSFTSAFGAVGEALVEGENAMTAFAKAALMGFASMLDAIAAQLAGYAILGLFTTGGTLSGPALAGAAAAATAAGVTRATASGFQAGTGGDFVVPEGFQGDSYPINVSSGERVRVDNEDQVNNSGSGTPIIIQIDSSPIYRGMLKASQNGVALMDTRAVVRT